MALEEKEGAHSLAYASAPKEASGPPRANTGAEEEARGRACGAKKVRQEGSHSVEIKSGSQVGRTLRLLSQAVTWTLDGLF